MSVIRYAKGPVSMLYRPTTDEKTGRVKRKKAKQILWGDWVRVLGEDSQPGWLKVKYGRSHYVMREERLQRQRVLEIIFLDVGQGDGCILTEPGEGDPRIVVIDAGVGDNMNSYLRWRFRDFPEIGKIHAAVITHPDKDHYYGFSKVFSNSNFKIAHVYHNGIIEREGAERLGPANHGYLTDIIFSDSQARKLIASKKNRGGKHYPNLIKKAADAQHIGTIEALTTSHGTIENGRTWMPGFEPSAPGPLSIEVLGPVVEPDHAGRPRLRQFGDGPDSSRMDVGKTKNGHSILLRLDYSGFRVLFGGDLNLSSETFLMLWYGNAQAVPNPLAKRDPVLHSLASKTLIRNAARHLGVDLMKTCHHGSADVTKEFLQATNASAYVISSGDRESYVHPRPDLLGLLGKVGRGSRPLLLSTELARSTREREGSKLGTNLKKVNAKIDAESMKAAACRSPEELKSLRAKRGQLVRRLMRRNVGVYGAINLRTDGQTAVLALRKEAGAQTSRWFYYEMQRQSSGGFVPLLKGH